MKNILLALSLLLSSCAENYNFKSIEAAGSIYCGLTDQGRAKCFRYFYEDSGGFGQNNSSPLVFDELGVPSAFSKVVFSSLKMADSPDEKSSRVCGYDSLKNTFCWDYIGKRKLARVFDQSGDERTAYQLPGDFGLVTNNSKLYDFAHQNDPYKFLLACSIADEQTLLCSNHSSSIKWKLTEKISDVVVGEQVCVSTENKIQCRSVSYEHNHLEFNKEIIEKNVTNIKELQSLSFESYFVLCAISQADKTSCYSVNKGEIHDFPLPDEIKNDKAITALGPLLVNHHNKLIKLSLEGLSLKLDRIEPTINDRLYQGAALANNSACLVENGTGKLLCYRAEVIESGKWEFSTALPTF